MDYQSLTSLCTQVRGDILNMTHKAGSGHPGGSLSAVELLVGLYFSGEMAVDASNPDWEGRDRFILSKGHVAPVLYSVLARKGFFPMEELWTLRKLDSILQGHPHMGHTPGLTAPAALWARGCPLPTAWPWLSGCRGETTGCTACWETASSRRAKCGRRS